jgi:hypothetical protein
MAQNLETPVSRVDALSDLSRLRLPQNFEAHLGAKRLHLTIQVRKPDGQWFSRVYPEESGRMMTMAIELKEDREIYLVDPSLWSELAGEVMPMQLFAAMNRQGVPFIWPVKLPREDGRHNEWHRSLLEAAQVAMTRWVRVSANMSLGAYDVFEATADLPDPIWPDIGFDGMLRVAFKDRFVSDLDHPVVRRLRGEM